MMATTFKRWAVAAAVAAMALLAGTAQAQNNVLRVVPHSNLAILDPIWTTAYMSRNHGYMIYDTLFGTDENAKIKPQMVESWTESADHRLWTFKLRKGLEFHDGKPVTGEDVIASLQRWGKRDAMGSALMTFVAAHGLAHARHLPHLPRRGLRLRARGARQAVARTCRSSCPSASPRPMRSSRSRSTSARARTPSSATSSSRATRRCT